MARCVAVVISNEPAVSVCGLKLLVYATSVCGLKLIVYETLRYSCMRL
jgi:hypothetical protein